MAQYISKSALIAEIERRKKYYENIQMIKPVYESNIEDFNELLSFINTIEVKEVDLEKEVIDWWNTHYPNKDYKDYAFKRYTGHYLENSTVINIAKHFLELGLQVTSPITAADRGMAEEIIINLKRVENDYRIDLTREIEWLRNKVKKGE